MTEKKSVSRKKKSNVENNKKALLFQEFLIDNEINVFGTESIDDDLNTVLFRSRLEVHGQILPTVIIIDTSIFTIIRTQIITGIRENKKARITEWLNKLNSQYKTFKYYLMDDGKIYLDICMHFEDDMFSPNLVKTMLSIMLNHLDSTYDALMEQIWSKN